VYARSAHISIGAVLAVVLVYRIGWRATAGVHLSAAGKGGFRILAKSMHWALYAGMLATVALGVANAWVRGDNLFNLYKLPAFDAGNKILRATVEDYHADAANLLLILAGLHAAAGVLHHYLLKGEVLGRMLPRWGRR
jgi:cytochrome b561